MTYEVYEEDDLILPALKLREPCHIRVELHDEKIVVIVGPREWEWSRKTGELDNAGTHIVS